MKVKFLKLHPDAVIPKKKYDSDFCYDVVAVREEEIHPGVWKYWLGFAMQIEQGRVFNPRMRYSIDLRPRSSICETGMVLSNTPGTGDRNYTGEYSMVFYHVLPNLPRYKVGDRVGQIKIGVTEEIEFVEVDSLNETDRSGNGYCSTGK